MGKYIEENEEAFLSNQDNNSFIFNEHKDFDANNHNATSLQSDMRSDFIALVG